jgi:hypothetical protein
MKHVHAALALALFCLGATVCSASESAAARFNAHRSGAGALGPDGWTDATSTQGNFSVRLPCLFNDFTFTPAPGDVVKGDVLGCDAGGTRFGATRIHFRDAALADTYFNTLAAADALPGATIERAPHRGLAAITRRLDNRTRCALVRVVRAEQDNIILTVETTPAQCGTAMKTGPQFLDSLTLNAPGTRDAEIAATLPECPVDAELGGAKVVDAFKALPNDVQERVDEDTCRPATVSLMILKHDGLCRIGNAPMSVASLMTLKDTGEPISMMFMAPYNEDTHAALQVSLEGRYAKQPVSAYTRGMPPRQEQTTVVAQPGGTLLILGKSSSTTTGTRMSTVQQLAAGNAALVNRDINRCE